MATKTRQSRITCPMPSCHGKRFKAQGFGIHFWSAHRAAYLADKKKMDRATLRAAKRIRPLVSKNDMTPEQD